MSYDNLYNQFCFKTEITKEELTNLQNLYIIEKHTEFMDFLNKVVLYYPDVDTHKLFESFEKLVPKPSSLPCFQKIECSICSTEEKGKGYDCSLINKNVCCKECNDIVIIPLKNQMNKKQEKNNTT